MRHSSISITPHYFDYVKFINEGWESDQSFILIFENGNITYTKFKDVDKVIFLATATILKYVAIDIK